MTQSSIRTHLTKKMKYNYRPRFKFSLSRYPFLILIRTPFNINIYVASMSMGATGRQVGNLVS